MDQDWLYNLTQDAAVVVPTRSLATSLIERFSHHQIAKGARVWESPNILLWNDYLLLMWHANHQQLGQAAGAHSLISEQQSLLLWTQVIETSKRRESELTLLNVQQTARAVQRSWRLIHDWQLSEATLRDNHVADIAQFLEWLKDYRTLLQKRSQIDFPLLQQQLLRQEIIPPFKSLHWHCYDLITAAQQQHNRQLRERGVDVQTGDQGKPDCEVISYQAHQDGQQELRAALLRARKQFEAHPGQRINVVVPELAQRHQQVREMAREVFYPMHSPLQLLHQPCVYRFSLGQALHEWPAIEAALRVIRMLSGRCTVTELSFLLRNEFLGLCRQHRDECRSFALWLQRQRLRYVQFDDLPDLYAQFQQQSGGGTRPTPWAEALAHLLEQRQSLAADLQQRKQDTNFAALSFPEWASRITDWLQLWGWRTGTGQQSMDSVQYQLWQRWQRLLEEFKLLSMVQRQVGLGRTIEIIEQMNRDAVFLPKAVESPIFISGVFEAIGRPADLCLLTGMSEQYPTPPQGDAFIPNSLLQDCGYPEASSNTAYAQARRVLHSLLGYNRQAIVSYALHSTRDQEVENRPSPLFRNSAFQVAQPTASTATNMTLESYLDSTGPVWSDVGQARGGSQIFINQSQCAFKAFATHQLQYQSLDEAEFGLDPRERGSVVHRMLQLAWQQLGSQSALSSLQESDRYSIAENVAGTAIADPGISLTAAKMKLLQRELPRLTALLIAWFKLELTRPLGFQVVETEQSYHGELGGIRFRFKIDRLDLCDDGRALLVDYKTGAVTRKDWLGERIKQPQLPLYALQLDARKQTPLSGIAYGQLQQPDCRYVALVERGLINKGSESGEQEWQQARAQWPKTLMQLADDFKHGVAEVNPIDEQVCQHCDLKSLCRVAQLKQLALEIDDAG